MKDRIEGRGLLLGLKCRIMFDKYTEPLHPNIINLNPWLRELFPLLNKT